MVLHTILVLYVCIIHVLYFNKIHLQYICIIQYVPYVLYTQYMYCMYARIIHVMNVPILNTCTAFIHKHLLHVCIIYV